MADNSGFIKGSSFKAEEQTDFYVLKQAYFFPILFISIIVVIFLINYVRAKKSP